MAHQLKNHQSRIYKTILMDHFLKTHEITLLFSSKPRFLLKQYYAERDPLGGGY